MLRRLLAVAALVGSAMIAPTAVGAVHAATTVSAPVATSTAGCAYRRDGQVWRCITPGAFCPAAAHGKYGYAKVTNKKYRCIKASGDIRWRWKPVR